MLRLKHLKGDLPTSCTIVLQLVLKGLQREEKAKALQFNEIIDSMWMEIKEITRVVSISGFNHHPYSINPTSMCLELGQTSQQERKGKNSIIGRII